MKLALRLLPLLVAALCVGASPASPAQPMKDQPKREKAMLGAGCFLGVEDQY